jgi:hypothetical protein
MDKKLFQLNSLKRAIVENGRPFPFIREGKNEFKEQNGVPEEVATIKGIFHMATGGYVQTTGSEGTVMRSKKQPMVMCLWTDVAPLQQGDYVNINNHKYSIADIADIGLLGIVADISLEVM